MHYTGYELCKMYAYLNCTLRSHWVINIVLFFFFFFERKHTASEKKMVTGMQVVLHPKCKLSSAGRRPFCPDGVCVCVCVCVCVAVTTLPLGV